MNSPSSASYVAADDCSERRHGIVREYEMLILQCHSEGVIWRGLMPLLFPMMSEVLPISPVSMDNGPNNSYAQVNENDVHCDGGQKHNGKDRTTTLHMSRKEKESKLCIAQLRAFVLLVNHFQNWTHRIQFTFSDIDDDRVSTLDDFFCCSISKSAKWCSMKGLRHSTKYNNISNSENNSNKPIILFLLPPHTPLNHQQCEFFQYYSRTPSNAPNNPFSLRLILNENNYIRLTSLSAYISTLGGGFFLCRYLSTAISLARRQCALALLRGDVMMAMKCRINEGYCYIHGGKFNKGKKKIRLVLRDALQMRMEKEGVATKEQLSQQYPPDGELSELVVIENMCLSSLRFAQLMKEASSTAEAEDSPTGIDRSGGTAIHTFEKEQSSTITDEGIQRKKRVSLTHDDLQRIRIVKDRKWKRGDHLL